MHHAICVCNGPERSMPREPLCWVAAHLGNRTKAGEQHFGETDRASPRRCPRAATRLTVSLRTAEQPSALDGGGANRVGRARRLVHGNTASFAAPTRPAFPCVWPVPGEWKGNRNASCRRPRRPCPSCPKASPPRAGRKPAFAANSMPMRSASDSAPRLFGNSSATTAASCAPVSARPPYWLSCVVAASHAQSGFHCHGPRHPFCGVFCKRV